MSDTVDPESIPDGALGLYARLDLGLHRHFGTVRMLESWSAKLVLEDKDGDVAEVIGRASVARCSLGVPGMVRWLDDEHVDLGTAAAAVLDPHTGETKPALADRLVGFEAKFLIVDRVELEPAWRGRGIGRWFAAEVLDTLSPGASFAALTAAPTDDSEGLERKRAEAKLRKVWAAIGFEPVTRDVMVLDLGTMALGERLSVLRTVFGA